MLREIEGQRPKLRQPFLIEDNKKLEQKNGHTPSGSKPTPGERACCEELDRIQAKLDELGVLLRELLQAAAAKPAVKRSYSTHDVARVLGKRPFTVREWCRLGRINACRALSGRGVDKEWRITHEELERIQNDGLLPVPKRY